ncbi:MAG: site-2 protease family protein [Chlamydiales bacterium]|nr:site-2 protease family protein [Chlamydiales bacterium]
MTVLYFVLAAVALGILVFIHELGHYFIAKKMGMTVETFGIGFGRPILKWRWQNVDWQLGWLPFGGFVKIAGMEFGKKEKEEFNEPYEIPNGFFSKAPWRRIFVAAAGPLANFILAFLIFAMIWANGGREKTFSEFTQIIGWVDPKSELYALGVRPGDLLTGYNGKPYTSSRDLLYAAMLGGKDVTLSGYHVDYETGDNTPFTYTIEGYPAPSAPEGILTTGITGGARYLIYDRFPDGSNNPLPEGSPMAGSGIRYGDQLVWADGEVLFSMDQLSHILNSDKTLLTVKRGDQIFLSRQPRTQASDLTLPSHVQNELVDWQYEADIKGRWQDLRILPYVVSSEGYIEAPLDFIDKESRLQAFPLHPFSLHLERPLELGDRIVAVDGTPVEKGYRILDLLQTHRVQLMVKSGVLVDQNTSWKVQDDQFQKNLEYDSIQQLASRVGLIGSDTILSNLRLLNPVEPKPISAFVLSPEGREQFANEIEKQREKIESIRDQEKRSQALRYLEMSQERLLLGITFQDQIVDYNPNPLVMFGNVFTETWQTLKALVMGYLHPRWLAGPIGIVQVIHHGWQLGIPEALFWIAAISINLGFLNLLPIPVLDGGYICLSLWEQITRRRLKSKTMERLIIPFVVLLIGLLVFLTFQDISRLFG